MPAATAMELLNLYRAKRQKNPTESRSTIFKYILWDRFEGRMILDTEINSMARHSKTLLDLTMEILAKERPQMMQPDLVKSVRKELERFFSMNAPDQM